MYMRDFFPVFYLYSKYLILHKYDMDRNLCRKKFKGFILKKEVMVLFHSKTFCAKMGHSGLSYKRTSQSIIQTKTQGLWT